MVLPLLGIFRMDFMAAMNNAPIFVGKLNSLRLMHDSISLFLALLQISSGFLELSSALWIVTRCECHRVGIHYLPTWD